MRNMVTIAAILSLAGCGGGDRRAPGNDTVAVPENGAVTLPAPPGTPGPAASSAPDDDTGIPAAMHGRWSLVPADCTSTAGDNKGLLTVTSDTLRFYESVGTLGTIVDRNARRIVADFAMTGEGQKWTRRMLFDLHEEGKSLIRREQGPDAMLGLLRYQRCA